ncbi:hypothetical protein ACLMJK_005708 [Lecanora helva]
MVGGGDYIQLRDFPKESDQSNVPPYREGLAFPTHFKPNQQTWSLLKGQASRFIFTVILDVLYVVSLKIYQDAGTVRNVTKHQFNAITTGLSLALGLNFLEAFKDMAKILRWRVLASRAFTVRETDLILGGESLMKLVELMWESMKKPLIIFVCSLWIVLNLLAQVSVATISLAYSMDLGSNASQITTTSGPVNASYLDYRHYNLSSDALQGLIHAYGEITPSWNVCGYTKDEDIMKADQSCNYFANSNNDSQEYAYSFFEYSPADSTSAYPYRTNRIVKASLGRCYQYENLDITTVDSPDGKDATWSYSFHNDTYKGNIEIPRPLAAYGATTFVWNGTDVPQNETDPAQVCGPRCVMLYAFQAAIPGTNRGNSIFQCPVTVDTVSEAKQVEHNISDENARLMAASIALSGRATSPTGKGLDWQQYQLYVSGFWETDGSTPQEVGGLMAQFAIGSITSAAFLEQSINITGTVPSLGYSLNVEWQYVIPLAAVVAGVHAVVVALMLWISRPIIVGGDSNIAVAKLLLELVLPLREKGSLLDTKGIAKAIEKDDHTGTKSVSYGVRETTSGSWTLEVSGDVKTRGSMLDGKFPNAPYT